MNTSSQSVAAYLRSFLHRQSDAADDDRELLRRFVDRRDDDAFTALLRRHGPMVLNLARRITGDEQLAEDVLQATFLLLCRKAAAIRRPEALPCWLHRGAHRLAVQARRSQVRRHGQEARVRPSSPATPLEELTVREFLCVLDEEMGKLPRSYRAPLILCCLEGLSQEEAAKRLRCSAGALRGRLERGRQRLRRRLQKRGLMLPAVLGGSLLIAGWIQAVPPSLLQSTLQAAKTGTGAALGAEALLQEAMRSAMINRLKALAAVVVLLAVSGGGLGMMMQAPAVREGEASAPHAADAPDAKAASAKRLDLYGDPLPEGALMRLGTIQRRAVGANLAVSADGQSIIAVRGGRYVTVWDAATGQLRQSRQLPSESSTFIVGTSAGLSVLSRDGRWLVTEGRRHDTLTIWDVQTGQAIHQLVLKGASVASIAFSPDGKRLAADGRGGNEQTIFVWDRASGAEIFTKHIRHRWFCDFFAFSPDGKRLLVSFSSKDEDAVCWEVPSGRELWRKKGFGTSVMLLTPDGKVLSVQPDAPALDLATGQPVRVEKMPPLAWDSFQVLSPDGRTLLLSTAAKVTTVWDMAEGRELRTLQGAGEEFAFMPDGKSVIANNGSLQRWDLATGKPLWSDTFARGHVGEVLAVGFSADGGRVVSGSADGSVRLWDATRVRPLRVWRGHEVRRPIHNWRWFRAGVSTLDITPDGRWILSAGSGECLKLWDTGAENEVRSIPLPPRENGEDERYVFHVRISPDGTRAVGLFGAHGFFFSSGQPPPKQTHKLAIWDLKTGQLLTCHPVELTDARSSALSQDGRLLLSGGAVVDVASGKKIVSLESMGGGYPCAFSRDGARAIGVSVQQLNDKRPTLPPPDGIRLWEMATGKTIAHVKTDPWIGQVALHPDGRFLATNDRNGIRLWDVLTGKVIATRKMPERISTALTPNIEAVCFAFTPDGRRLATGMADSTILIWDVPLPLSRPEPLTAKELASLWADLADADAAKAWRAVWRMAAAPDTLSYLRGRLHPVSTAPAELTRKLLADLDDGSFERREAAAKRLKELGAQAEPALRAVLRARPSLEQKRRIEELLAALAAVPPPPTPEELRQLRAVIILEHVGSPEARRMLEELATGPEPARLTHQARAALACLRR